jgi:hypothetical protein
MNDVVRDANVYFLPVAPAAPATTPVSRWSGLTTRVRAGVCRFRFVLAGFRMALRRPHPGLYAEDDGFRVLAEQRTDVLVRRPRLVPARIIDFGTARARLRPVAAR